MLKKSEKISLEESSQINLEDISDQQMSSDRKEDHITLAFQSQSVISDLDNRFYYEPLLKGHPVSLNPKMFLGKSMKAPIWISSMTGGTELAYQINHFLARACKEFGLGMGLGSCRILLEDNSRWKDFNLRPVLGDENLLFANLGIAQIEQHLKAHSTDKIVELVKQLQADGLIIHINPLQEWLQPEGDIIDHPPIETIKKFLEKVDLKVIIKEVGQGMGPESLKELFQLPLAAIEFAAHGGTNFSKVELLRSDRRHQEIYKDIANVGHGANQMVEMTNLILDDLGERALCKEVIVSGGIKSFLDGFYLINKINCNSVYGQGSSFLAHARSSYEELQEYIISQIKGLELATTYLKIRE